MDRKTKMIIDLNHAVLAHGFAKQSMNALAKLINVSRATLYLYFKNKEEIISAIVDRHLQFIAENQPTHITSDTVGYVKLRLNTLLLLGARSPVFTRELAQQYPQLAIKLDSAYKQYEDAATKQFATLQKQHIIAPEFTTANLVRQDDILVTGVIRQILDERLPFETVAALLQDYFASTITGSVTPGLTVDFSDSMTFQDTILGELRATYYYA